VPFSDFKGYENTTRVLQRIAARRSFHSAYLFHGPSQVGKRRIAQAFAMAIFCQSGREGDFCGECSACRRMLSGAYPDYHLIEPDGAFIKIEQTREMIADAAVYPHESPRKIFVLDPAERMRAEAANSLLKVLEEPFEFAIFILITANPNAILPTIDSRCQKVRFTPLPTDLLAAQLQEQYELDSEAAATLARLAGGRPGLCEQLAKGNFLDERDVVIETLAAIGQNRDLEVFRVSQGLRGGRDAAIRFFQLLIPVLRDAALLKESGAERQLFNLDRSREIAEATRGFSADELLRAWEDAIACTANLYVFNANVQAQIERVLLHLCPVEEIQSP